MTQHSKGYLIGLEAIFGPLGSPEERLRKWTSAHVPPMEVAAELLDIASQIARERRVVARLVAALKDEPFMPGSEKAEALRAADELLRGVR